MFLELGFQLSHISKPYIDRSIDFSLALDLLHGHFGHLPSAGGVGGSDRGGQQRLATRRSERQQPTRAVQVRHPGIEIDLADNDTLHRSR